MFLLDSPCFLQVCTIELGYNNLDLCDTSDITLYIQWYQMISYKACVFLPRLVRHT
jgi:hypothetical protein